MHNTKRCKAWGVGFCLRARVASLDYSGLTLNLLASLGVLTGYLFRVSELSEVAKTTSNVDVANETMLLIWFLLLLAFIIPCI